jgi:mono/diheme cytochrome c family protein
MKRLTGAFLGVAIVVGLFGGVGSAQAPDPKLVAAGKRLFSSKDCTQCHMAEGKGNKKLRMDGPKAKVANLPPEEIRQWIVSPVEMTAKLDHKPENPMKKKVLTEAEVDALVAYMAYLRTKK